MFGENKCKLLTLSDEVIMMILQYLPTKDLISVGRSCLRFKRLYSEKRLMTKIINPPDDYESTKLVFRRCINTSTTVLSLQCQNYPNGGSRHSICPSLLLSITPRYSLNPKRTPHALTHLHVIRQSLDGRLFMRVTMFPNTLKLLELTGTHITHVREDTQWFKGMSSHFKELEEVILKYCSWVTTHALLAISKCPRLLSLNLEGCGEVGDSVPYTALAARNGFLKLKILNLNNTDVCDSDIESLRMIASLEEMYVGKYDDSRRISCRTIAYFGRSFRNLRVLDISGSILTTEQMSEVLRILATRFISLQKLIACMTNEIPVQVLESLRTDFPSLEIVQG